MTTAPRAKKKRIGLGVLTLVATVAMTIATGLAVWAIETQQAEIESKNQRIFDVAVPTVVEDIRKVRMLDRLAREGESVLWIEDPKQRDASAKLLAELASNPVLQDGEADSGMASKAATQLRENIADLDANGSGARLRALAHWKPVRLELLDESERIATTATTFVEQSADSITQSTRSARIVVIVVSSLLALGALGSGILVYFSLTRPLVQLAKILKSACQGISVRSVSSPIRELQILNEAATDLALAHRRLDEAREKLDRLAHTDELTGLANRRMFEMRGSEEVARSRRSGQPMAVVAFDIDHFKRINDTFSHDAGDAVLRELGALLQSCSRASDAPVARVGGEEFTMILNCTELAQAVQAAERLRKSIESLKVRLPSGQTISFSASLGVAELGPQNEDLHALVHRADLALYRAKSQGRNRVVADTGQSVTLSLPGVES